MNHTPTPWHQDAAFTVRACNAHEALVEMVEAFQSYLQDDSKSPRRKAECLAACDVALKLAKGE